MKLVGESKVLRRAAGVAALALALSPAALVAHGENKKAPAVSISFDRFSSFTPASADPRLAAAFASRAPTAGDFHFTPAAPKGRPAQLRVAIRARAVTAVAARGSDVGTATAAVVLAPATYNLGVAVGWRRFAVSGDVAKVTSAGSPLGGRESAALGVSYNLKRFTGRVALGADRGDGNQAPAMAKNDNVSLDLGGAYSLTRNIALTGGVRYKIEHERLSALADQRRDSQAVYVGTAFKF
ncbi:MAG: hypothetical protein ABR588_00420 [Sphingomicrobium sp.]|nr:hypothetical protein [Sphingomonadales bacterium]